MTKNGAGLGKAMVAIILCMTLAWTGCSTAWITEAEEIVAALIPAAANLLALVAALEGKTVSASDLQLIQNAGTQAGADLQLIQSLITEYETADASAQPGILNQIQVAIGTVQSNLNALLGALHIQDAATQAKITAVVGLILSEVQSLAAIVPLVNGGQSSRSVAENATRVGQPRIAVKAPLRASEFVKSYNATMTAKTGNTVVDRATAGLRIHRHGKFVRWATLGIAK